MAKRATTKDKAREVAEAAAKAVRADGRKARKPPSKPAPSPADAAARPLRLEYVQAKTLSPNRQNWRTHPKRQLDALQQSLGDDQVGWAGAMLYNEQTGRLIDGHGRLEITDPEAYVPVLVGSWSDAGERKILATLDPIAVMARADAGRLEQLLADLQLDGVSIDAGDALGDLLASLPELVPPDEEEDEEDGDADPDATDREGDGEDYEPSAKILLTCTGSAQQETLIDVIDRLATGDKVTLGAIRAAFDGVASRALNG